MKLPLIAMSVVLGAALPIAAQNSTPQTSSPPVNSSSQSENNTSHDTIRNAQQKLMQAGYYTGKIDGLDGPETQAAIKKYQQANHLTANGQLDDETCTKLGVPK